MSVNYKDAIQKMKRAGGRRLIVNIDDIREWNREFCDGCVSLPPFGVKNGFSD